MPSFFQDAIKDYFYGVVGILRKRAKYRCEKRGEEFSKYEETVKNDQRTYGKPDFEARMNLELKKPSLLSQISKENSWIGSALLIPFEVGSIRKRSKRKRSKYRRAR